MPTIVYPPTPLKLGKTPSTTEWRGKLMLELYVEDRDKIPKDCHIVATVQGNSVNIRFHDIIRSDRALGAEETL